MRMTKLRSGTALKIGRRKVCTYIHSRCLFSGVLMQQHNFHAKSVHKSRTSTLWFFEADYFVLHTS